MTTTFPWLGEYIAPGYESYREEMLAFEYETEASTAEGGSLMMAVDYDAQDSAPVNKQQLMAYDGAVRSSVWNPVTLHCSPSAMHKLGPQKYVRLGSISSTDIKTYDVGNLFVATQGCADTSDIGELYAVYTTRFSTPQLNIVAALTARSAKITSGGTVSDTAIFGSAATVSGGLDVDALDNTLTFNRVGQYLVSIDTGGTGLGGVSGSNSGTPTATVLDGMADSAATSAQFVYSITVNNRGETFIPDFSAATTVTSTVTRIGTYAASLA
jgi:hypothetical protein